MLKDIIYSIIYYTCDKNVAKLGYIRVFKVHDYKSETVMRAPKKGPSRVLCLLSSHRFLGPHTQCHNHGHS